ncbi:glycosyltransferase family 39 protein [Alphaproteobacteria bacterium]|nr:glycosyltransferase family 39 protein [Alphaproteobacteria bacterium]
MQIKLSFLLCGFLLLIKIFAIYSTNFDLFGDEAQYWIWSKNPDLGYYSKPPLLAWLITFATLMFGDSFETIKLISMSIYVLTSVVIYLIFKQLYKDGKEAILAGTTFYLIPAATVSSFLISTDIVLIFFWSFSLLFLLKIRGNPSKINFILLGIFIGLSFLSKYAAIYFILSIILIFFIDPQLKKVFLANIISVIVCLFAVIIIVLPNIVWNIQNGWVTLSHTSDNASLNRIDVNFVRGLEFIIVQLLMLGPILFAFLILSYKKISLTFETKFLLTFCVPIFIIILIESILVRANANWAAPALISLFIFFFHHAYMLSKNIIIINIFVNFIFGVIFFTLIASSSSLKVFDRINGISEFAFYLEKKHMDSNDILVVGDRLLFSNLKYLFKNANFMMFSPHTPNTKVTSQFHLSSPLSPTINKNFIFIGHPEQIKYLQKKFNILKIESVKVVFKNNPIEIYEVFF